MCPGRGQEWGRRRSLPVWEFRPPVLGTGEIAASVDGSPERTFVTNSLSRRVEDRSLGGWASRYQMSWDWAILRWKWMEYSSR